MKIKTLCLTLMLCAQPLFAQQQPTDANTPLHRMQPNYPVPYGIPRPEEIARLLRLVHAYLDETTPTGFVNARTNEPLTDLNRIDENTILRPGDFRLVSYEWGNAARGWMAIWEPVEKNLGMQGLAAIVNPVEFDRQAEDAQNNLVVLKAAAGRPVSYWAGFAWDRAGKITSAEAWKKYVDEFAEGLLSPIEVSVSH